MEEKKHHHKHQTGPEHGESTANKIPYWQRAHRDWRLWIAAIFIAAALYVYVMSVDLSMVPNRQPTLTVPSANGK